MSSHEYITTAADDLILLREQWHHRASNRMLRASSAMVRRLLVDDHLVRALKAVYGGSPPSVEVPDLERSLAFVDISRVEFATFGRAKIQEMEISGCFYASYAISPEAIKGMGGDPRFPISIALTAFKDATGMIVKGRRIPNRQIVQYVANKLGGAHFDPKRNGSDGEVMRLLDDSRSFSVGGKPAVYFQLLSIGQALTSSRQLMSFAEEFSTGE